jgi:hypothetical protein
MIAQSTRRSRLARVRARRDPCEAGRTVQRRGHACLRTAGPRRLRVARGADQLALSRDVEMVASSGRRFVRWKTMLPHVPRSNPDAEGLRVDRETEGRREGDRLSVDAGRDGSTGVDAQRPCSPRPGRTVRETSWHVDQDDPQPAAVESGTRPTNPLAAERVRVVGDQHHRGLRCSRPRLSTRCTSGGAEPEPSASSSAVSSSVRSFASR